MTVMGVDPLLLGSSLAQDGTYVHADLTNPDVFRDGRLVLAKDQVHIERTLYVHAGGLRQRVMLSNYGQAAIELPVAFSFDNDFADIFEVRGITRARRGSRAHETDGPAEVVIGYVGLDGARRATRSHVLRGTQIAQRYDGDVCVLIGEQEPSRRRYKCRPGYGARGQA